MVVSFCLYLLLVFSIIQTSKYLEYGAGHSISYILVRVMLLFISIYHTYIFTPVDVACFKWLLY
jgi:hypothetical protein